MQRYRGNGGTEKRSGDHVIQIRRDNVRDCSITSGDVSGRPEMHLGCYGYDTNAVKLRLPRGMKIHNVVNIL